MNELDRFFRQVRLLDPLSIVPDENTEFSDNSMPEYTSTSTQSSIKNIPHERIIPIKLVGEQSTNFESLNYNSSQLPLTKPYLFDPKRTTHHEYLTNLRKDGRLSDGEYANIQNFDTMISRTKPHETLINDIPRENEIVKKQSLPSNENENGAGYLHMRRTPPPEYSTETRALSRHSSDDEGRGTAKIKKRMSPLLDIESQQKALHSRSAVQRQIARRTSSGSEHSKIYGAPSQQQHLAKNRQVKQTEQVIKNLAALLSPSLSGDQ
ncbi:unnamed protein product [Litomosoides sigmodontis]|uniref:Uncharacterized protein n=1 Tax=Litomosoides sigmodontis TaxID=42156 RepID=A0A3P6T7P5_LITSI|nr:unnamed protein product [Litomosoides sigmodontis]